MIKLTRHVKNNLKLYKITKKDIEDVIRYGKIRAMERNKHIVMKEIKGKFENMPLKVIYTVENEDEIIITVYPLRKNYKGGIDESKL